MSIATYGWRASLPNMIDVVGGIGSRGASGVVGGELCTLDARALTYHPSMLQGTNALVIGEDAVFTGDLNRRAVIRGVVASPVTMCAHTGATIGACSFEWALFCSSQPITVSAFALTDTNSRQMPAFQLQRDAQQIMQGVASTGAYMPVEIELPRSARYLYAIARVWMPKIAGSASANPGTEVEIASGCLNIQVDV